MGRREGGTTSRGTWKSVLSRSNAIHPWLHARLSFTAPPLDLRNPANASRDEAISSDADARPFPSAFTHTQQVNTESLTSPLSSRLTTILTDLTKFKTPDDDPFTRHRSRPPPFTQPETASARESNSAPVTLRLLIHSSTSVHVACTTLALPRKQSCPAAREHRDPQQVRRPGTPIGRGGEKDVGSTRGGGREERDISRVDAGTCTTFAFS